MTDSEKAAKVIEALKAAERKPPQVALKILNDLVGLVQGGEEQPLEIEEARSGAFLAICEVGKALHRGSPPMACGRRRSQPRSGGCRWPGDARSRRCDENARREFAGRRA